MLGSLSTTDILSVPSSVTSNSILSSKATIAYSIFFLSYRLIKSNFLTILPLTDLLFKIAINLFISSLILDKPKSATGNGDKDESKLNLPASDDRIIACEEYHFGKSNVIIIEAIATNPTFLIMNHLFFHNIKRFFCMSVLEESSIFSFAPISSINPYLFKSPILFLNVFSDIPFLLAIFSLILGSERTSGVSFIKFNIFCSCEDNLIISL